MKSTSRKVGEIREIILRAQNMKIKHFAENFNVRKKKARKYIHTFILREQQ